MLSPPKDYMARKQRRAKEKHKQIQEISREGVGRLK